MNSRTDLYAAARDALFAARVASYDIRANNALSRVSPVDTTHRNAEASGRYTRAMADFHTFRSMARVA